MHTNPFATEAAQYAHLRPTYPDATEGTVSLEALELAGEDVQNGKVLLDVANPLAFSQGMYAVRDALRSRHPSLLSQPPRCLKILSGCHRAARPWR